MVLICQFLDPLEDFPAVAAASTYHRAWCPWQEALDRWPLRDAAVASIRYVGRRHTGGRRLAHVHGALLANARFYASFAAGDCGEADVEAMMSTDTTVVHPQGQRLQGEHAMESWHSTLGRRGRRMAMVCRCQQWRVDDALATVVCTEDFGTNAVEATNIYTLSNGRWLMLHHHASHPD
mmetsp:Transcript_63710/g.179338  ORF Transcript_63710/g.179338 Transcript_63710/m.179338 type:complete len:179 (+) Transcript_63710:236-772(+)